MRLFMMKKTRHAKARENRVMKAKCNWKTKKFCKADRIIPVSICIIEYEAYRPSQISASILSS